jgi:ATP-dependent RNA helicase DDX31/DBP7
LRSTDVFKLHGNMTQVDRQAVYEAFRKCTRGVLFCTDVAARGLDIPQIDLIAHYDPPTDERCYVHRVGRTARIGASGESLLFLMPHEVGFAKFLGDATKRALEEVNLDVLLFHLTRLDRRAGPGRHWAHSAAHLTRTIAQTVRADQSLRQVSLFAYQSFVRAYSGMPKQVRCYFDARQLHLGHAASAFAIESTPAELQRELRMNRVVKEERTLARDAQRVRKQGIGMIDGGQTSGPGGATTGRGYGYGHGANSGYHSTLVRKAVHVTKDRIDSGVGVKQGATQLRAMNEFEA